MNLNSREWNLLLATIVVILGGSTWMLGGGKLTEWQDLANSKADLEFQKSRNLERIGRKSDLLRRMETVKLVLPQHPIQQDLKSDFLQQIQNLADKSALNIRGMDPEKEKNVGTGGLYKLAINTSWQGTLKELVPFLYDMQTQGVTMDVRQLNVKGDRGGQLKGNLIIDFAYSRVDVPAVRKEENHPAPAPTVLLPTVPTTAPPSSTAVPSLPTPESVVPVPSRPKKNAIPMPSPDKAPVVSTALPEPQPLPTMRKPLAEPLKDLENGALAVSWNGLPVELLLKEYTRLTGRPIQANGLDVDRTVTFNSARGVLVKPADYLAIIETQLEQQGLLLTSQPDNSLSLTQRPPPDHP